MVLEIALLVAAVAFVLFALLAWRITPIVFMLMRSQVGYAETWSEMLKAIEKLDERFTALESRDVKQMKARLDRLEKPKPAPRRKTVTRA
jgi:hypothetical protein